MAGLKDCHASACVTLWRPGFREVSSKTALESAGLQQSASSVTSPARLAVIIFFVIIFLSLFFHTILTSNSGFYFRFVFVEWLCLLRFVFPLKHHNERRVRKSVTLCFQFSSKPTTAAVQMINIKWERYLILNTGVCVKFIVPLSTCMLYKQLVFVYRAHYMYYLFYMVFKGSESF